jgi:hypothetical protein
MKHSTRYNGKNPIPDANRLAHKNNVAPVIAEPAPATVVDDLPTPAETARAAAQAAVAISRLDAKSAPCAADADPNVTVKHAAVATADVIAVPKRDPLADVPAGTQILADTSKLAAAKRAAS